jgi:uncharacterized membrane protein YtjA (UPF0391 family)
VARSARQLRASSPAGVVFGVGLACSLHSVIAAAKESVMFSWAIAFFIIALIAGFFGFFGVAASAAGIAKIIFVVALIMAVITFVLNRRRVATN